MSLRVRKDLIMGCCDLGICLFRFNKEPHLSGEEAMLILETTEKNMHDRNRLICRELINDHQHSHIFCI